MMRTCSFIAPFLFIALAAGCASNKLAQPKTPDELFQVNEPASATPPPPPPPSVAGDIQFTMSERQAKSAPADETTSATALTPAKANTTGMTTTGVTVQHVHSSQ